MVRGMEGLPMQSSCLFPARATRLASSQNGVKRKAVARVLIWLAAFLACAMAWGDIEIKPQYDANEPIVATVTITDVPVGAKLRGSFAVSDGSYLPAGENVYHVWAPSGKHTVTAQGVWVLTEPVVVGDKTIQVLVDFGQFSYSRTFQVGSEVPPGPFPQPPPVPVGERWSVIFEETSQRTPQQASLFVQLRKSSPIQILDVSQLPPAWSALEKQRPANLPLPVQMVLVRKPDKSSQVIRTVALPSSVDAVKAEEVKP